MSIRYLEDLNCSSKRVLVRVDFNVPLDEHGTITDDTRIRATLPTIKYLVEQQAKVILVSHLGRPKGKKVPEMSLLPAASKLSEVSGYEVSFSDSDIGSDELKSRIAEMNDGEILLLENIRFYPGEEKNDEDFGKELASLCDVYVNDAFATAHRGHASNAAITQFVSEKGAGFLLKNEIEYCKKALEAPKRPFGVIIGGAKVSTKLDTLKNILNVVDFLLVGGGMAFTFLKAKGMEIGKSLLEEDLLEEAKEIMQLAEEKGVEFILPLDAIIAPEFSDKVDSSTVAIDAIPADQMGLDIGPKTTAQFIEKIENAATVIWNGPVGAFEMASYAEGSKKIADALAQGSMVSIIGGGDTVTAVNQFGVDDEMSYISTGGGAFLELMEGKDLPGFSSLEE